jgi:hypothetical protein
MQVMVVVVVVVGFSVMIHLQFQLVSGLPLSPEVVSAALQSITERKETSPGEKLRMYVVSSDGGRYSEKYSWESIHH